MLKPVLNTVKMQATFGLAIALLLLIAGAPVCRASAAEPTVLTIGTSRDPNNGAPIIIAKAMNYFKENGLDATVKYFPSGGDMVSAMASQALEIGSGGSVPATTLRAGGFSVIVLAQQADISDAQELVGQKDVASPKDLEGKKVGALFGTVSEMLVNSVIAKYHLQRDKITLVNLSPADQLTALLRGDIAAGALWVPWSSDAIKHGAHRIVSGLNSYIPGKSGASTLIGDHSLLFASKDWTDKNPAVVAAILKSLMQAEKLIANDPDKAAQIVGAELQVPPAEMREMMKHDKFSMAIDGKLIRDMNAVASFLGASGKLKRPVKAVDWVDPAALKRVAPTLVSWSP